jgi:glycosyltransferase involved in cell wall biosynthesis
MGPEESQQPDAGPEASVVIPMLNASEHLAAALDSVAGQQAAWDWEVVVADNGSTDDSREIVESYRDRLPGLTLVDASAQKGRPYALNVAVQASRGRSVIFFDSDDVLAPGYLQAMLEALRTDELACASTDVEGLNALPTFSLRPSGQRDGPMNYYSFLPWGGGGTLGVTRRLFDALGGFDASIAYLEDIDFCWRAQLDHGARLAFVEEAVLRHRYRADVRGVFEQTRRWSRDEAKLRRIYEDRGMPPAARFRTVRGIWWLCRRLGMLRDPAGRFKWLKRFGNVVGQLEGRLRLGA